MVGGLAVTDTTELVEPFIRAGELEPEPVGAGCFWLLGAGAGAADSHNI